MAEKRYYWIKLKTDFFNQDAIDFLMGQDNGCEYIVLYQMLCLQTANNNGRMATEIGEIIAPYDVKKIVRDTKYFDADTVMVALELFMKLGLIYREEDSALQIANFDELVGSECASAHRVRKHRALQSSEKALPSNNNVTQEIEIDKEKELESDLDSSKRKNNKKKSNNPQIKQLEKEFEEIWKLYPKKVGKSVALSKYIKARQDGVDFETVKNGVKRYAEFVKGKDEQYIRHGKTWFNQKGWDDEYNIKQKTKQEIKDEEELF